MSVLDLLARAAGFERVPAPRQSKTVEAPYTWPTWADGQPDWTAPSMGNFAAKGYAANAIVYACISEKAGSASLAPLVAYTGDRAAPERLPDSEPLARLLLRPNPSMSWFEFQELLITYLDLDGNAFIYKAKPAPGRPTEALYPLRSDRVRPVPRDGQLLGYVYDPQDMGGWRSGGDVFLPDEIIHVKYPNPQDVFEGLGRGLSPLTAAMREVDLDNYSTSFLATFFTNAVVPFGLLKSRQKMTDGEVARVQARLRAQYAGSDRWNEVMVLDADAEYQRLGLTIQELDFSVLDMRNEARIAAALKVPPIIVGLRVGLEHNTFSNNQEARQSFWEDKLIPHLYQRFEGQWNVGLADEFPGCWLAYDYSNVPALKDNESTKRQDAVRLFMSGIARRNEARRIASLDPVPDDQDGFRQAASQQQEAPAIGKLPGQVGEGRDILENLADELTPEEGAPEAEGARQRTRPSTKAAEEGEDMPDARTPLEQQAEATILAALGQQLQAAIPEGMTPDEAAAVVQRLNEATPPLRVALREVLLEAVVAGIENGADQLAAARVGLGVDWGLANEAARDWAERYTFELVRGINETSQRALQAAVSEWVQSGRPLTSLTRELEPIFGARRAELIAITETTRAYAEGNIQAWLASGLATQRPGQVPPLHPKCRCWLTVEERASEWVYVWRTAADERLCPVCGGLHDTAVGAARAT